MTPAALVETLRARGVTLQPDGDRLRVRPAEALTPDELDTLRRHKGEVLRLLSAPPDARASARGAPVSGRADHETEYRAVLARAFALIAAGPAADAQECRRVLDDEARLVDEVGVARADEIRARVARQWYAERGVCPYCGERGPYHAPRDHP